MPRASSAANRRSKRRGLRTAVIAGLTTLLVVDALFFVLVYRPGGVTFLSRQQQLNRLREELAAKQEAAGKLSKIAAALAEAEKQGGEFYTSRFLPKSTGYSTVMEEVDKIAVASSVRKGSVNYGSVSLKDRPDIEVVEISTTLDGDYARIVQFVNRLEQSPLFLTVDSMALGTQQGRGLRLVVKFVTYFRVAS
jgi:Tfp pilus assembly protein PilO